VKLSGFVPARAQCARRLLTSWFIIARHDRLVFIARWMIVTAWGHVTTGTDPTTVEWPWSLGGADGSAAERLSEVETSGKNWERTSCLYWVCRWGERSTGNESVPIQLAQCRWFPGHPRFSKNPIRCQFLSAIWLLTLHLYSRARPPTKPFIFYFSLMIGVAW